MKRLSRFARLVRRCASASLLALPVLALPASSVHAAALWPADPVRVELVDREDGQVLPRYRHEGQWWTPGQPGHRYAVRLHNRSGRRVLAVLSVDGINAVDGRTADPHQAGYVLDPWETLEVAGWRKSLDAVAQFVFVDPAGSYAARTGRPDNLGVIGVAVFRERTPAYPASSPIAGVGHDPARRKAAPSASAPVAAEAARDAAGPGLAEPQATLGTGHGTIESSQAFHTVFDRAAVPAQVTELRYDTPAMLAARGIRIEPWRHPVQAGYDRPRAFPGTFVPDPP